MPRADGHLGQGAGNRVDPEGPYTKEFPAAAVSAFRAATDRRNNCRASNPLGES